MTFISQLTFQDSFGTRNCFHFPCRKFEQTISGPVIGSLLQLVHKNRKKIDNQQLPDYLGDQYQSSTKLGQDPISSSPPLTKICKLLWCLTRK